ALCLLVTTLGLALAGFGFWSLILGSLVSRTLGSVLAVAVSPHPLAAPLPLGRIADSLQFGAWVTVSSLAWYVFTNADRVVVGRLIGETALGAYTIGVTLASMPLEKIGQLYQRVS